MKKYNSKWSRAGVSKKNRRRIYERLRVKAYLELKRKHKKEYSRIIKNLIKKEIKLWGAS